MIVPSTFSQQPFCRGLSIASWKSNYNENATQNNQTVVLGSDGEQATGITIMNVTIFGLALVLIVAFCVALFQSHKFLVTEYDAEAATEVEVEAERQPLMVSRTPARIEKTPAATYIFRCGYGMGMGRR